MRSKSMSVGGPSRRQGRMNQPIWRNAVRAMPIVLALSTTLAAQWPRYPSPVPKTPDGKPNLSAQTPRTADGKPDFTGLWEPVLPPKLLGELHGEQMANGSEMFLTAGGR